MRSKKVEKLYIYPIKSCRGIAVERMLIGPFGPLHDREYVVVDKDNMFLSQREHAKLCLVSVLMDERGLSINIEGLGGADAEFSYYGHQETIRSIAGEECKARWAGSPAADRLFSELLGIHCKLMKLDPKEPRERQMPVSGRWAPMGFGDEAPFLVVSESALQGLNRRLADKGRRRVGWEQFRPTIVIGGAYAHAEDYWKQMSVGGIDFSFEGRCDRCKVVHTDQRTARGRPKGEPTRTLMGYRADAGPDGKQSPYFGSRYLHLDEGSIAVGDSVVVRHDPWGGG
ncbi:MAG TPA: MOSC N-terminal beta barrel domain-containing protein [Candidatus Paceibacterota bacterium]|nr:MOSC N-terminal beta barrel domain-containing protein [Candidatus Paceibacterota bacterium]